MSAVTVLHRKSALSQMVGNSGGRTVMTALKAADKAVESMVAEGRVILLEAITALEQTATSDLDAVYRAATDIIDVCPPDLPALHKAVYSLCDLADRQRRSGRFDKAPIAVHIAALRPLSQPGQPPEAVEAILQGLAALQARDVARSGG